MWRFIAASLILPLRIYFQPNAFREQMQAIAPELDEELRSEEARDKLSDPSVRQQLITLGSQALLSIPLWIIPIAMLLSLSGIPIDWLKMALGVAFGWRSAWREAWPSAWPSAWREAWRSA
jgi:hypothetical protein